METAARLTPGQRDRALRRIKSITTGAAIAGVAAFGAFGYLAFSNNPGSQVNAGTTDDSGGVPIDGSNGNPDPNTQSGSSSQDNGYGSDRQSGGSSYSNSGSDNSGSGSTNSGSQQSSGGFFRSGTVSHSHAFRAHVVSGGS